MCVCVYTLTFQSVHVRLVRVNQEDFHSSFIFIISSSLPLEDKQNRLGFFYMTMDRIDKAYVRMYAVCVSADHTGFPICPSC